MLFLKQNFPTFCLPILLSFKACFLKYVPSNFTSVPPLNRTRIEILSVFHNAVVLFLQSCFTVFLLQRKHFSNYTELFKNSILWVYFPSSLSGRKRPFCLAPLPKSLTLLQSAPFQSPKQMPEGYGICFLQTQSTVTCLVHQNSVFHS